MSSGSNFSRSWGGGWLSRKLGRWAGTGSLHRQLLLWLLLPQLVLWLAAAFVTYNVAARYAGKGIDASLLQATRSLARQVKPIGNGLFIDLPRAAQDIIEADPDDRVYTWSARRQASSSWATGNCRYRLIWTIRAWVSLIFMTAG